ncbi:sirohydrochlorin chelatase [Streptomyces xiamenensis]|uniref:sirohydrochlorin chelatase n=1 Tax=Streptomyces sp. NRRL F-2890 TaxID=1463845 RepID=UPI0004C7A027|nr:CbiX/SirB N-terminal domain-containing protein [Streptomyces sp. NRRL F-2890]
MTGAAPLLLIAHGSRDPGHAATVHALAARIRSLRPGLRVTVGFLEFNGPRVREALAGLYGDGEREVTAVPLLLTRAYHAKTDIPAALAACAGALPGMTVRRAEVLGRDPLLLAALERRLARAEVLDHGARVPDVSGAGIPGARRPGPVSATATARRPSPGHRARSRTGVVLAAAGSSDPAAIEAVGSLACQWARAGGWGAVRPAFAAGAPPGTADAVRALRADGIERVLVAPLVIAPGRLPARIAAGAREAGADALAPVLGAAPELAALLLRRYDEANAVAYRAAGTYL